MEKMKKILLGLLVVTLAFALIGCPRDTKAAQTAPDISAFTATAETEAGNDGKITIDTAKIADPTKLQYKFGVSGAATAVASAELTGLATGSYYFRYAETGDKLASEWTAAVVVDEWSDPSLQPATTPIAADFEISDAQTADGNGSIAIVKDGAVATDYEYKKVGDGSYIPVESSPVSLPVGKYVFRIAAKAGVNNASADSPELEIKVSGGSVDPQAQPFNWFVGDYYEENKAKFEDVNGKMTLTLSEAIVAGNVTIAPNVKWAHDGKETILKDLIPGATEDKDVTGYAQLGAKGTSENKSLSFVAPAGTQKIKVYAKIDDGEAAKNLIVNDGETDLHTFTGASGTQYEFYEYEPSFTKDTKIYIWCSGTRSVNVKAVIVEAEVAPEKEAQIAPAVSAFTPTAETVAKNDGKIAIDADEISDPTTLEYKFGENGEATAVESAELTGLTPGDYYFRFAETDEKLASPWSDKVTVGEYVAPDLTTPEAPVAADFSVTNAGTDGNGSIDIVKDGAVAADYEYKKVGDGSYTAVASSPVSLPAGKYVFRIAAKAGVSNSSADSPELEILAYQAAPDPSLFGVEGEVTGVTAAMEYKIGSEVSWTQCDGNAITGLSVGYKVYVRYAAKEGHAASEAIELTVEASLDQQNVWTFTSTDLSTLPWTAEIQSTTGKDGDNNNLTPFAQDTYYSKGLTITSSAESVAYLRTDKDVIQTIGAGAMAYVKDVKGPARITVEVTNTGSNSGRTIGILQNNTFAELFAQAEGEYALKAQSSDVASSSTTVTLSYKYSGTDVTNFGIVCVGGALRVKKVTIDSTVAIDETKTWPVESVDLDQKSLDFNLIDPDLAPITLTATVNPSWTTDSKDVTWISSDTSVATVDDGVVSAVAEGTAIITVTSVADVDKTDTCTVTVTEDQVLLSETDTVKIAGDTAAFEGESAITLTARLEKSYTEDITYQWYKDNVEIPEATNSTYSYMPGDNERGSKEFKVVVTSASYPTGINTTHSITAYGISDTYGEVGFIAKTDGDADSFLSGTEVKPVAKDYEVSADSDTLSVTLVQGTNTSQLRTRKGFNAVKIKTGTAETGLKLANISGPFKVEIRAEGYKEGRTVDVKAGALDVVSKESPSGSADGKSYVLDYMYTGTDVVDVFIGATDNVDFQGIKVITYSDEF